jgi:hypothetical protein
MAILVNLAHAQQISQLFNGLSNFLQPKVSFCLASANVLSLETPFVLSK